MGQAQFHRRFGCVHPVDPRVPVDAVLHPRRDLALLLSDLLSPTPVDGRWPADVPYPYCGLPQSLVLRAFELEEGTALCPRPTVRPGTVVIDRGRNYQSVTFMAACEQLRINVQSARPYRGSDKGWTSGCSEQCASGCSNHCLDTPARTCSPAGRTSKPTPSTSRTSWRRSSAGGSPWTTSAARTTGYASPRHRTSA